MRLLRTIRRWWAQRRGHGASQAPASGTAVRARFESDTFGGQGGVG